MARKVVVMDDLTGEEIPEDKAATVTLSLNGDYYELDLSEQSQAKLDKALEPFISKAKKVPSPQSGASSTKSETPEEWEDMIDRVVRKTMSDTRLRSASHEQVA